MKLKNFGNFYDFSSDHCLIYISITVQSGTASTSLYQHHLRVKGFMNGLVVECGVINVKLTQKRLEGLSDWTIFCVNIHIWRRVCSPEFECVGVRVRVQDGGGTVGRGEHIT